MSMSSNMTPKGKSEIQPPQSIYSSWVMDLIQGWTYTWNGRGPHNERHHPRTIYRLGWLNLRILQTGIANEVAERAKSKERYSSKSIDRGLAINELGHLVRYPGLQNHTCSFVMTFSS
jgi:hypothetical protein